MNQLDPVFRAQSLVDNAKIANSELVRELTTAIELALQCGSEIMNANGKSGATWKVGTLML